MAASTTKRRRFQAPITSFFTTQPTQSDDSSLNQEPLSSPPLPEAIQSSLLTVGMRIRKSVPEGYKTHKTIYPSARHAHSGYFLDSGVQEYEPVASTSRDGYAELAPFCGLHKIGGMAVQPMPVYYGSTHAYQRGAEEIEEPDPWSVPASQESMDSNVSLAPSNKRGLTFDLDDDDDEIGIDGSSMNQHQPPYPFSHTRMPNLNTLTPLNTTTQSLQPQTNNTTPHTHRPFAIPRTRLRRSSSSNLNLKPKSRALEGQGQENIRLSLTSTLPMSNIGVSVAPPASTSTTPFDFEDANFLKAREDVDELMDG
jgi:Ribonucleotide reductase inhibitor